MDSTGGPAAGAHSFFRGAPLATYDAETRRAIEVLGSRIPAAAVAAVWDTALAATYGGEPVWFHGDVAAGNLLVRNGHLSAAIDFGCCGVGDPACDLAIAWTFLTGSSRHAFRSALSADPAWWARGRGWALWKAVTTLAHYIDSDPVQAGEAKRVLDEILTE